MNASTLSFLKKLARNNNRDWFNEHKHEYEAAREDMVLFVEKLIAEIATFDEEIGGVDARKSLFRIHRDTRFSHNKDPYKINFGASIVNGRGKPRAGYYFHLQPGKSFLAGGIYMLENEALKNVRKEISGHAESFIKVVSDKKFCQHFGALSEEGKMKRVPLGFEKDDPMGEYLKLKHFVGVHQVSDEAILEGDACKKFSKVYRSLKPLNGFINASLA
ncbi:DUF2461 domain-containing protein [Pseudochryseolinea flava]|uniref:DUF2461 domain-containing protein n=1 Tax=Pseudochryseolinea flava TaxID=2059302 RepID=A0A364Y6E3_9BACT|nr:DUF2461 domain-containing protein [Pseudochryseolinea flava]RAW02412.1 DUF2461 domain-containing protein [Pseudochryseolinea flava]